MWESPSHEKEGTTGGKVHALLGGLEGFVKGFGAEGSARACATGGFIRFPFWSLMGNFEGGTIKVSTHAGVPLQ